VLIFGIINPFGYFLISIGLQMRSLKLAFVIAPLVITAYVAGLPYGPTGVAFAYSAALTLWLVPHVIWCLHGTMISLWDIVLTINRPLVSGVAAAIIATGAQWYFGQMQSPVLRLAVGGGTMLATYLLILLFVMGQGKIYVKLLKSLKASTALKGGAAH